MSLWEGLKEMLTEMKTLVKGFESEGFKTQVQPLSHFQEAYGLEADGDEGESDEGGTDEDESEEEQG